MGFLLNAGLDHADCMGLINSFYLHLLVVKRDCVESSAHVFKYVTPQTSCLICTVVVWRKSSSSLGCVTSEGV